MSADKDDENWDFDVTQSSLRVSRQSSKSVRASGASPKKGRAKAKKMKVDVGIRKKKSRAAVAREAQKKAEQELIHTASANKRLTSYLIDLAIVGVVAGAFFHFYPQVYQHVIEIMSQNKISQTLPPSQFKAILIGIPTLIAGLLFVVIPGIAFRKSPGKMITKTNVNHVNLDKDLGTPILVLRETIFKLLSIATVIGLLLPFVDKKRRALHDILTGTAVYED
jgi:uncharacterized RDD family membrane protein YckC